MKRQTLLMIVFALVLLPITYWQADKAQKERQAALKKQHEEWTTFFEWVAKNPDKLQLLKPKDLARLRDPRLKPWMSEHPAVAAALAALASGAPAPVGSGTVAAPGSATPSPSADALPPRRRDFLDALSRQKPTDWKLTTKTFTAHLSATGGTVDSLSFNELKEASFKPVSDRDIAMKDLEEFRLVKVWDPRVRSFGLSSNATKDDLEHVEWLYEEFKDGHRFTRVLPDGDTVVTKEYILPTPTADNSYEDYHFILRISVENQGDKERAFNYALTGPAGLIEPTTSQPLPIEAAIGLRDEHGGFDVKTSPNLDVWKAVKAGSGALKVEAPGQNRISFFGLAEKQFACVVIPQDDKLPIEAANADTLLHAVGQAPGPNDEAAFKSQEPSPVKQIIVTGTRSSFAVSPGKKISQDYVVYAGPLWKEQLEGHPVYAKADVGALVSYPSWIPGVRFLAILLTKLLVGFHWITRSWGVAIILLTIMVRACLHPLMVWQTKNTQKMQALAPETAKLKAKYQDKDGNLSAEDQKKFQAEQMALWQKHGLGPAQFMGCLGPMFLQLPIFIGLWNALRYAFELRQAGFLWIRDLTEPDVVARLPFSLPMHGMNALCILPIIMLVVYIVQMRTMPKSVDPQQQETQKMMQWMMPVFGYMFYSMQSGLLLYYITSSLLGMAEQRWIKKRLGIVPPPALDNPHVVAKV